MQHLLSIMEFICLFKLVLLFLSNFLIGNSSAYFSKFVPFIEETDPEKWVSYILVFTVCSAKSFLNSTWIFSLLKLQWYSRIAPSLFLEVRETGRWSWKCEKGSVRWTSRNLIPDLSVHKAKSSWKKEFVFQNPARNNEKDYFIYSFIF